MNLLFLLNIFHFLDNVLVMLGFTVRKCGFCERRIFGKKQKTISYQVCDTSFHKRCTDISERNFNLALRINAICYF